ncbi:unnamed protein product [Orchesella dallaii]|uniref:Uncharacterized protein n=1 Tax=Orchesella dallaii TaxID=48710 RepID=A0ABP1PY30_9HEXA
MHKPKQVDVKTLEGKFSLTMGVGGNDCGSHPGRIACIKEEDCEEIVQNYDSNVEFDQGNFSSQIQPQTMMENSPVAVRTMEGEFSLTMGVGGNDCGSHPGRIACIKEEDCEEIVQNYDSNVEFDQGNFSSQIQPQTMMENSPVAVRTMEGEFSLTMGVGGNDCGSHPGRIACIKEEDCEEIVQDYDSNVVFDQGHFSSQIQPQTMMENSPVAVRTLEGEFSLTMGAGGNDCGSHPGMIVCIKEEDCEEIVQDYDSNVEFDQGYFSSQIQPQTMMENSPVAVRTLEGEFSLTMGVGGNDCGSHPGRIACIKEEDCEEIVQDYDSNVVFDQGHFSSQIQPQTMMENSPVAVRTLEGEFSLTMGAGGNDCGSHPGMIVCIKEEDCEEIVQDYDSNVEFDQGYFSSQIQPQTMMENSPVAVRTLEGEFSLTMGVGGNDCGSHPGRIACIKEEDCEEIVQDYDSNVVFDQGHFSSQIQPQTMMENSPVAVRTLEGEFSLTMGAGGNDCGSHPGMIVCIKEEDCEEIVQDYDSNVEFDQGYFSSQIQPQTMMENSPVAVRTLEGEFSLTMGVGGNDCGSHPGRIACIKEEDCEEIVQDYDSNVVFDQGHFSSQIQPQTMMENSPVAVRTLEGEFSLTMGAGGNDCGSHPGMIVCIKEEDCEEIVQDYDSNVEFDQGYFSSQIQPQTMMENSPVAVRTLEGEFSLTMGAGGNDCGSHPGSIVCIKEEDCEEIVQDYDSNVEFDQGHFSSQIQPQTMMENSPVAVRTLEGEFSLTMGAGGNDCGSHPGRIVCIKEEDCEEIVQDYDSNVEFDQGHFSSQIQPQTMMENSPVAVRTLEGKFSLTMGVGGNDCGIKIVQSICFMAISYSKCKLFVMSQ